MISGRKSTTGGFDMNMATMEVASGASGKKANESFSGMKVFQE
jgi:hypothetical protein